MKTLKVLIFSLIFIFTADQALANCEEFSNRILGASISAGVLILYDLITIPFSVKHHNESKIKRADHSISYIPSDQRKQFGPNRLKFSRVALTGRIEKNFVFQTDEPDKLKLKSTLAAYGWTVGAILIPVPLTYAVVRIFSRDTDGGDRMFWALTVGGTVGVAIGPSAGHWYAGQYIRTTVFSVLRLGIAGYGWRNGVDYYNCID